MNILETIIEHKKREIVHQKLAISESELEKSDYFSRKTFSLAEILKDGSGTGIIAEFKRRSPSKGVINEKADLNSVIHAYVENGASGLSILTDMQFFGGSAKDIMQARKHNIPILRKDFMIDEYQIVETKSIGADVILLIAASLSPKRVQQLASFARKMGLEVLLEIHDDIETGHICDEVNIIGINNRDLKTFQVDINRSIGLISKLGTERPVIAESGINAIETISRLRSFGFQGFLIGENFMKEPNPAIAFASFVNKLKIAALTNGRS